MGHVLERFALAVLRAQVTAMRSIVVQKRAWDSDVKARDQRGGVGDLIEHK